MLLRCSLQWLAAALLGILDVVHANDITLGLYGPMTSQHFEFIWAGAAAFYDFKKNFDPAFETKYGPKIVQIPDLDARLANLRLVMGNSDSDPPVGVTTGKDFCLGYPGEYDPVNGIIGGYHSAISMPIASLAAVLDVVQVSWGSTSPALSNKAQYGYFSRTIPPDSVQGKAFWGFTKFFGFKAATYFYEDDGAYGSGLYEAVKSLATEAGEGEAIVANPMRFMPPADFDNDECDTAIQRLRQTGNKLVMMTFGGANNINVFKRLKATGTIAPHYVILASESAQGMQPPALDGSVGAMGWAPVSKGPKYPEFKQMWSKMSTADVEDHLVDFGMNTWSPKTFADRKFPEGWSAANQDTYYTVEQADALQLETPFIFDAFWTFIVAMNDLLKNQTLTVSDLKGKLLLDAVRTVNFDGISGAVSYDAVGDRLADYDLMNNRATPDEAIFKWRRVGGYSAATDIISMDPSSKPLWGPGMEDSEMPPQEYTSCQPGSYLDSDTNQCVMCSLGHVAGDFDAASCEACQPGFATNDDQTECVACEPGRAAETAGMSECSVCGGLEGGYISAESTAVSCDRCAAGKTSSVDRRQCVDCPKGKITAEGGLGECQDCAAGTFTDVNGSNACTNCAVGRYQDVAGMTDCIACGGGSLLYTTMQKAEMDGKMVWVNTPGSSTEEDCGCKAANLEDDGALLENGVCVPCKEGLRCEGMGDFGLKIQFWSSKDKPQSVFRCESKERCPGGKPGAACGPKLTERSCAQCEDEYVWTGDKCEQCASIETTAFLFPILPILLGPIVVIVLYKLFGDTYEKWGSPGNGVASIVFILLNHYQIITILGNTDVTLPVTVDTTWKGLAFSSDVSTVFKPQCAGNSSFQSMLIWKTLGPAIVALIFLCTWGVSQLVGKANPNLTMEPNRTINGFFSLMFTFFAGIVEMSFALFKCGPNPNGARTLAADRSVICFDNDDYNTDDWKGMLGIGIVAVVVWCVGFGALFARTVIVAPGWFHDKGAQMRWKFLFIKYRSDVHWWSLVIIGKGIMLNIGFLFLDTGVAQIYWVMSCVLAYTAGAAGLRPWRHMLINLTDIWAHLMLIIVSSLLTWFASAELEDRTILDDDLTNMIIAATFLGFVGVIPPVAQFAWKLKDPGAFTKSNLVAVEQFYTACHTVSNADKKEYQDRMMNLTEWDLWFVKQAKDVLMTELLASKSRSGLTTSTSSLDKGGNKPAEGDNKKDGDTGVWLQKVVV